MLGWFRRKRRSGWQAARLFARLTKEELDAVAPLVRKRSFAKGVTVVREGEQALDVLIVESGELAVVKRDGTREHRLDTVSTGEVAGDVALFEELPRFASLRAEVDTELYALAIRELGPPRDGRDRRSKAQRSAYQKIVENLTEELAARTRVHAGASLAHARHREAVGTFLVHVLVMVCAYTFLLSGLRFLGPLASTSLVSIPVQIVFGIASLRIIRQSGYPLSQSGLGFSDLIGSLIESVLFTPFMLGLATLIKAALLWVRGNPNRLPVVEFPDVAARFEDPEVLRMFAIYSLTCLVQELIVRSALQANLERFLTGRAPVVQAVVISALLFGMMHLHISFVFAVCAIVSRPARR